MIPLKDDIPSERFPLVNYLLIALCVLAFVGQLAGPAEQRQAQVERYGMIPVRVLHPDRPVLVERVFEVRTRLGTRLVEERQLLDVPGFPPWLTLITSTFLHGGWIHLLGNLWMLYIFGDNIEDRLGHIGYLLFYLGAGVTAGLFHLATNTGSSVPTIGASGAIAGVMGAYSLLYPRGQVLVLVPIFFILQLMVLPAGVFLGIWFLLQLLQGTLAVAGTQATGIAWWAHIGGFLFGAALAWLLRRTGHLRALRPAPPLVARRIRPARLVDRDF